MVTFSIKKEEWSLVFGLLGEGTKLVKLPWVNDLVEVVQLVECDEQTAKNLKQWMQEKERQGNG